MNSIEDDKLRAATESFFDEVLMPMAERIRANGIQPFPMRPDVSRLSYYTRRSTCSMTRADFTDPSCIGFDDFERSLARHWKSRSRHELVGEVPRITAIARAAHAAHNKTEDKQHVSPLIYAMF